MGKEELNAKTPVSPIDMTPIETRDELVAWIEAKGRVERDPDGRAARLMPAGVKARPRGRRRD